MTSGVTDWVARASRVLVAVSRRNNLFLWFRIDSMCALKKVGDGEDAFANTRDACATRKSRQCVSGYQVRL